MTTINLFILMKFVAMALLNKVKAKILIRITTVIFVSRLKAAAGAVFTMMAFVANGIVHCPCVGSV